MAETAHTNAVAKSRHRLLLIVAIFITFTLTATGGLLIVSYTNVYANTILPGVRVGSLDVGKKTKQEVRSILETFTDRLTEKGIPISFTNNGLSHVFPLRPILLSSPLDQSYEYITLDTEQTTEQAFAIGRHGDWRERLREKIAALQGAVQVPLAFSIDETTLKQVLQHSLQTFENPPTDAGLTIQSIEPLVASITPEQEGTVYDYTEAIEKIKNNLNRFSLDEIHIAEYRKQPDVTIKEVQPLLQSLANILSEPLSLRHTDPNTKKESLWVIPREVFSGWLIFIKKNGVPSYGLSFASSTTFIKSLIAPQVEIESLEAKFTIGPENRVVEFQGSRIGQKIDMEASFQALTKEIASRITQKAEVVSIIVAPEEPKIKTADVNTLGIKEIIGVGTSNFAGSPANRIKNIQNGAKKLNGILIAPKEEFSLLQALKPFTTEGGYLPELVIKGDKIEPETGGGLCQIGTTTFRTTMNSGLPITERRNHSLVVTYYNDPSNKNPGTDATIYDPRPDFRFINDTGHYILFTTSVDTKNSTLTFTFWGTSDGRKGYYAPPTVTSWIGTGEPKYIETTDLPVGKEKCQSAHPGAKAHFTYTVELPNGEIQNQLFESSYRPLPKICLKGVEKKSEETNPDETNVDIEESLPDAGAAE